MDDVFSWQNLPTFSPTLAVVYFSCLAKFMRRVLVVKFTIRDSRVCVVRPPFRIARTLLFSLSSLCVQTGVFHLPVGHVLVIV